MHNDCNNSLRNSSLRQLVLLLLIDLELFNSIGTAAEIVMIIVAIIIPLTSIFYYYFYQKDKRADRSSFQRQIFALLWCYAA
jgi:hypothetical protein